MIFNYNDFLINESKIKMDDEFHLYILDWRNKEKDPIVKSILNRFMGLEDIDIGSKRLNKSEYSLSIIDKVDRVSLSGNEIKIGRLISTIFPDLENSDIEKFVNKFKSRNDVRGKFEIVSGDDISFYYQCKTNGGSLGGSCMKDLDEEIFDFYTQNDNVCKLLILKDGDELLGRSILWKSMDSNIIMDRTYTRYDSDIDRFIRYAQNKGWYYRTTTDPSERGLSDHKGREVGYTPSMKVNYSRFHKYPWLDTFPYLNVDKSILSYSNDWLGTEDFVIYLQDNDDNYFYRVQNEDKEIKRQMDILLENDTWQYIVDSGVLELEYLVNLASDKERFIEDHISNEIEYYKEDVSNTIVWSDVIEYLKKEAGLMLFTDLIKDFTKLIIWEKTDRNIDEIDNIRKSSTIIDIFLHLNKNVGNVIDNINKFKSEVDISDIDNPSIGSLVKFIEDIDFGKIFETILGEDVSEFLTELDNRWESIDLIDDLAKSIIEGNISIKGKGRFAFAMSEPKEYMDVYDIISHLGWDDDTMISSLEMYFSTEIFAENFCKIFREYTPDGDRFWELYNLFD